MPSAKVTRARILREWSVNARASLFYERRRDAIIVIAVIVQVCALALLGVLGLAFSSTFIWWLCLTLLAVAAVALSRWSALALHRATARLAITQGRLLILERRWNRRYPKARLSTFTERWALLDQRTSDDLARYQRARNLFGDPLPEALSWLEPRDDRELVILGALRSAWMLVVAAGVVALVWFGVTAIRELWARAG